MGHGSFSSNDWQTYAATNSYATKSTHQIFTQKTIDSSMDPTGLKYRESCDSADNPLTTAVIIGLDTTSSMGMIAENMAKKGVPTLMENTYDRKPIPGPQILFAAVNDVRAGSSAPLQVTQFESDIRIAKQLEKVYLEGGGGGNGSESYALAWYFAAKHTKIDCFDKRGQKGLLFTIGDDGPTPDVTAEELERVFGPGEYKNYSSEELLTLVSRQWEVFHIMVAEGQTHSDHVRKQWEKLIGERAVLLTDYTKLAEVVTSIMQVTAGADHQAVTDSWDKSTALVVRDAIKGVQRGAGQQSGVVTL